MPMTTDDRFKMIANRLDMLEALVMANRTLTIAALLTLEDDLPGFREKVAERAEKLTEAELAEGHPGEFALLRSMIAELFQPSPAND